MGSLREAYYKNPIQTFFSKLAESFARTEDENNKINILNIYLKLAEKGFVIHKYTPSN